MRLLFFDAIPWDYHPITPLRAPLGGSQSALCYLTAELARHGHQIFLFNHVREPGVYAEVACFSIDNVPGLVQEPADAAIVLNPYLDDAEKVRPFLHPQTPLVMWAQHAPDQEPMAGLNDPRRIAAWDAIVSVSQTHCRWLCEASGQPATVFDVLPNAIGPAFENLFLDAAQLLTEKSFAPRLAYTSTPFRGLEFLPAIFPQVRQAFAAAQLDVITGMQLYQQAAESDPYLPLYRAMILMPGVRRFAPVAQADLAQALRPMNVLAYPNHFAEGYCIAVVEALAAGLHVVTSDLGALPESTRGWATLVPAPRDMQDMPDFVARYTQALIGVLEQRLRDPRGFSERLWDQVKTINADSTWRVRAVEWELAVARWRERRRARLESTSQGAG